MGDIAFHFTPADQASLEAANDNDPNYRLLRKLVAVERECGVKADKQIDRRHPYGYADQGKA